MDAIIPLIRDPDLRELAQSAARCAMDAATDLDTIYDDIAVEAFDED